MELKTVTPQRHTDPCGGDDKKKKKKAGTKRLNFKQNCPVLFKVI